MRLYQSPDGVWSGTQADAKAYAKSTGQSWTEIEVPTDKVGLMAFLNEHRVGGVARLVVSEPPAAPVAQAVPQAISSIPLEEAIWELPLGEAIRLGGVIMERIREFAKRA